MDEEFIKGINEIQQYIQHKPAYIASPYSDPNPEVEGKRYTAVLSLTGLLQSLGVFVYSPIVYGHHIKLADKGVQSTFEDWEKLDLWALENCGACIVMALQGLENSKGVKAEVQFAQQKGLPIFLLSFNPTGTLSIERVQEPSKIVNLCGMPYAKGKGTVIH